MLPSEYLALPREEKAFLVASIKVKMEDDKKNNDKLKRKGRKSKKGK